MDIVQEKRLLRRTVLARRGALDAATRSAAALAAAGRMLSVPEVAAAQTVMAFASFGTEIDADPLIAALLSSGRRVLAPKVAGARMRAIAIQSLEDLAPGYRDIREPLLPPGDVDPIADVIVAPGVAFDAGGRRLGYGGGFYDAFLARASGFRAGLCFDLQLVERVPAGPSDLPVDVVVTESRTVRAAGSAR